MEHILSLRHKWRVDSVSKLCRYEKHKKLVIDSFLLSRLIKRDEEQDNLFRSNIDELIKLKKHQFARDTLCLLFFPLILKLSLNMYFKYGKIYYPKFVPSDVFQEAYLIFLKLLNKFDLKRSVAFSHYVNVMLKKYLYSYVMNVVKNLSKESVRMIANSQAFDRHCLTGHRFVLNVLADIVYKDFIELINIIKNKKCKASKTYQVICDDIFLGSKETSQVAKELGITYHAVYEIEKRIQKQIADMINSNKFSTCYIDIESTQRESGRFYHTFKIRNRRYYE